MRRAAESLAGLNRCSEEEFLRVGAKLIDFRSASRRITSAMSLLTELISGQQAVNAANSLSQILEYSKSLDRSIEESGASLTALGELARRVRLAFSGIPAMVIVLRNLCTLTRVETARLGDSNVVFGDLAADVIPLSESIQSSGKEVLDAADRLNSGVQAALRTAARLHLKQRQEISPLMDAVTTSIREFAERQDQVRKASVEQGSQYQELSDAIDGMVGDIQFHDITHQQVEHVIEGLNQACSGRPALARAVVRLQSSQLRNSATVFAAAVARIGSNLESIAARLSLMAGNSSGLLSGPDDDHNSFVVRMEEHFGTILESMAACAEAQDAIRSATAQMAQLVAQLESAIAQIRGLEIRIQRTAMNASIRAVHIGPSGASLAVIAEAMERLVAGSCANTDDAALAVEEISGKAGVLAGDGEFALAWNEASVRLRAAIAEMQSSAEISYSRVNEIVSLGAGLAGDIVELRGSFSATARIGASMEKCCSELERIAGLLPAGEDAESPELADMASRYTMQIERDIHDQVTQGAERGSDALGDNVEMW